MGSFSCFDSFLLVFVKAALVASGIFSLAPSGCASDKPEISSCDPFAKDMVTVKLETILGVGRDAEGVVYVADESEDATSKYRVFVSSGDSLYRKEVLGGSSPRDPETGVVRQSIIYIAADNLQSLVMIESDETGILAMAVLRGEEGEELDGVSHEYEGIPLSELGGNSEVLEVLDETAVSDMTVQNLPNTISLIYLVNVENGGAIAVTHPKNDWDLEDFELFYGETDLLIERKITEVREAGESWRIFFDLDGVVAEAYFEADDEMGDGNPTLTVGDEILKIIPVEYKESSIKDYSFSCIVD